MEPGTISSWVAIGTTILLAVYTWFATSQRATKTDITTHSARLAAVEAELKSMPTKDSFHQLELAVAEVKGTVRAQEKELNTISATTTRIEKWLLDSSTKRTAR